MPRSLLVEHSRGEVPVADVGEHGHDPLPLAEPRRQPAAPPSRRRPEEMPTRSPSSWASRCGHVRRIVVRHRDDLVVDLCVQDSRNEVRADALDGMRARLAARKQRRGSRLHGDDPDVLELLLQDFADARDGAARSDAGHEGVDLLRAREGKDLLCRGPAVHRGIRGIAELVGLEKFPARCNDLVALLPARPSCPGWRA